MCAKSELGYNQNCDLWYSLQNSQLKTKHTMLTTATLPTTTTMSQLHESVTTKNVSIIIEDI